jgi:anaphase-promoting complex subunit 2
MAQVAAPISARNNAIFASVFPKQTRPRVSQEQKRAKSTTEPQVIKQDLYRAFKPLVGIEVSSRYAYGLDGPTAEGQPFVLPITKCASMNLVRRPTKSDHLQQRARLLKTDIWQSIGTWQDQMGVEVVRKVLGEVLDNLLHQYVHSAYSETWVEGVIPHLEFWVQHIFSGLVSMCLEVLNQSSRPSGHTTIPDDLSNIKHWTTTALTALGALRVSELPSIVAQYPQSTPAINDLKCFITSPATRTHLTTRFTSTLSTHLLHPGTSTISILKSYILIIRVFRLLDPKGVLLDRVARRIRKYLKDRPDTVTVIVSGLLSDPLDNHGSPIPSTDEVLSELALELIRRTDADDIDDNELDWDNLSWVPDPIDAAPDYMKSKNTDVIGSVTSLFESKDIFVKELQTTLADRLLRTKPNIDLEISVIEHLKQRFGDSALQSCEVMLRDIIDSHKVNGLIQRDQESPQSSRKSKTKAATDPHPELHAKILSRLFWPSLPAQPFKVPPPISQAQHTYEKAFESLKETRKLTWLPSQGHVVVELTFDDRTIQEEVLPYQASVIYAFQEYSEDEAVSVNALATQLEMAEALVRSACMFWVAKRVLIEKATDQYTVLERLPSSNAGEDGDTEMGNTAATNPASTNEAALTAAAELAANQAAREAEATARKEKMAMYTQFIVSMLTNQGAMPLGRIAMMLGMVVPGGFPFGTEELREFLAGMVREGKVEVGVGGNYRVVN